MVYLINNVRYFSYLPYKCLLDMCFCLQSSQCKIGIKVKTLLTLSTSLVSTFQWLFIKNTELSISGNLTLHYNRSNPSVLHLLQWREPGYLVPEVWMCQLAITMLQNANFTLIANCPPYPPQARSCLYASTQLNPHYFDKKNCLVD